MSYHHEFMVWQNENGTWNAALFKTFPLPMDREIEDPEWETEWDHTAFSMSTHGHLTPESARQKLTRGSNWGQEEDRIAWAEDPEACKQYDKMVEVMQAEDARERAEMAELRRNLRRQGHL